MTTITRRDETMNQQKLAITSVLIAVALTMVYATLSEFPTNDYVYVPSDITKANPNLKVAPTEYTMLEDITHTKKTVVMTVSGMVLAVGDPIPWIDYANNELGYVPITIEVDRKSKDTNDFGSKKGDNITFYVGGGYEGGQFFVDGFEAQFEIGEKVLVHLGKATDGPPLEKGGYHFVELGKYGKYKVIGDKAYNEHHKNGKLLDKTFDEAR